MKLSVRRLVRSGAVVAALLFLGLGTASCVVRQVAAHQAKRDFPPPGRLLDIEGRLQHIHCTGTGSPTILLESGLDDRGSSSWARVQQELARNSRVCSYDRAGLLWSEPGDEPRDAERIATELHALLAAASEDPPYVMAGHSLGGLYVRVYDARYPGEVAGFVLVDAAHAIDSTFEQASRTGLLGDRPVIVLTSGVKPEVPDLSAEVNLEFRRTMVELQAELADLSTNSTHHVIDGAGHYIHVDRPAAVIEAVRDVVMSIREKGAVE